MSEFAIPKRASVDDLKDILKAYYIEGAHAEPVSTDSVEATADMGDKVGRQTNFLTETNLIAKEGRERRLTEDGESVAEALMGGNESLAQSLMRQVMSEWGFTDKIKGFVRMQEPEPVEEDRLMEYISANASSKDDRGRRTLIELLVWAGVLDSEEEGYTLSEGHSDGKEEKTEESDQSKTEVEQNKTKPVQKPTSVDVETENMQSPPENFSINIEISPSNDPSQVEEVILAARRALREGLDEDGEE